MGLAIIPLLTFLKPALTSLRALEADPARRILLSTWITGTLVATANMVALAWYPATTILALMYTMPAFTSLLDMRRSGVWSLRSAAAPVAALSWSPPAVGHCTVQAPCWCWSMRCFGR